jgi:rare lipoprotein A
MSAPEFVLFRLSPSIIGLTLASLPANAAWTGKASYYGLHGRTASGAHVGAMTAAHRSLPFGTPLRVTNLKNGHSVVVRVNDRGPFARGRIIDVSTPAADALGFRRAGVATVRVEQVSER